MSRTRRTCALLLLIVTGACATRLDPVTLQVRGATIIDPGSDKVVEGHCIAVRGTRIAAIAPCESMPAEGAVIDATGKWLIPGLWDMHVHAVWHESVYCTFFSQFLRYGVIGVRDMGGDAKVLADARKYLAENNVAGPVLVAAGPFIDGPMPVHPELSLAASTYADGVRAVGQARRIGADFIKIYTLLPADAAMGVFDEARRRKLDVVGHLPAALDLDAAIAGGMRSIEHLAVETGGLCDVTAPGDPCAEVFAKLRDEQIYLTPTLVVRKRRTMLDDEALLETADVERLPDVVTADWLGKRSRWLRRTSEEERAELREQYQRERALTVRAIEAGSMILAGTDAGDLFVPPGRSLHDELELLVDAGMSQMETLRTATSTATDFFGFGDRGHIRPGDHADFVILDRNPLRDIRATRAITSVVTGGRLVSGNLAPVTCQEGS